MLFISYILLTAAFLATGYGVYVSESESFWESFFIEANAVILFFLLIPAVLSQANKPGLKLETCLFILAVVLISSASFAQGAWQSILLEFGIATLALTGLELIFNRFLVTMKIKQQKAIEQMRNKPFEN